MGFANTQKPMNVETSLESFVSRLPRKPYCTNDPRSGLLIRKKDTALRYGLLQINSPREIHTLVFDVDTPFGGFAWETAGLPPPSLSAINPENGHAHLFYFLKTPVVKNGRSKPLRYLKAIEAAFKTALGADSCYVGLVAKNPFSKNWQRGPFDTHRGHELEELADHVRLARKTPENAKNGHSLANLDGVAPPGRNVALFNNLRYKAYSSVRTRNFPTAAAFGEWVFRQAEELNSGFARPLPVSEVKATANSVAHWVWKRQTGQVATGCNVQKNTERQKTRSLKGVAARRSAMETKMAEVAVLRKQGKSINAISKETGYPYESVRRWCAKIAHNLALSDSGVKPEIRQSPQSPVSRTSSGGGKMETTKNEEDLMGVARSAQLALQKDSREKDGNDCTESIFIFGKEIPLKFTVLTEGPAGRTFSAETVLSFPVHTDRIHVEAVLGKRYSVLRRPVMNVSLSHVETKSPPVTFKTTDWSVERPVSGPNGDFLDWPYKQACLLIEHYARALFRQRTGHGAAKWSREDVHSIVFLLQSLGWPETMTSKDMKVFRIILEHIFLDKNPLTWKERFPTNCRNFANIPARSVAAFCLASGRFPENGKQVIPYEKLTDKQKTLNDFGRTIHVRD